MPDTSTPGTVAAQIIPAIGWFAEYVDFLGIASGRPVRNRLAAWALLIEVGSDGKPVMKLVGFLPEGDRADHFHGFLGYSWAPVTKPQDPWGD